jgi:hypothetical protein
MQKRVLFNPNLIVKKETFVYEETPEELEQQRLLDIKESVKSMEEKVAEQRLPTPVIEPIVQLEFKWDKKSTASTESLLESDSDDEVISIYKV